MQTESSSVKAESLGSRLLAARQRMDWSLTETASRTGLSRAYINALEHGRGKRPGADAIRRLEDVFGPLQSAGPADREAPGGLQALAEERQIPASEVRMLAGLRIRGQQPRSKERWRFIYDALIASEQMDANEPVVDGASRYGVDDQGT